MCHYLIFPCRKPASAKSLGDDVTVYYKVLSIRTIKRQKLKMAQEERWREGKRSLRETDNSDSLRVVWAPPCFSIYLLFSFLIVLWVLLLAFTQSAVWRNIDNGAQKQWEVIKPNCHRNSGKREKYRRIIAKVCVFTHTHTHVLKRTYTESRKLCPIITDPWYSN
jgi:hypothetical protein